MSGDQHSMSSNKHNRYHYHVSQYRKKVLIQGIGMNTRKQHSFEKQYKNGFKLFTTIKKIIIVKLSSRQADKQVSDHPIGAKQNRSEANAQH